MSKSFCRFSQSSAEVPSALPSRSAVSAVIAVSSLAILSMRVRGTPHAFAERPPTGRAERELLLAALRRDASVYVSWPCRNSPAACHPRLPVGQITPSEMTIALCARSLTQKSRCAKNLIS